MLDEIKIIQSPLEQRYESNGRYLLIQIYRSEDSPWVLEIVDDLGGSTVWDDEFVTDQEALDCAIKEIESVGIESFTNEASPVSPQPIDFDPEYFFQPLTDDELEALDYFFIYQAPDEAMTFDMVDGMLHALAVGPVTVPPSQWLPKVWGSGSGALPEIESLDDLNEILGLLMRHNNAIIAGLQSEPSEIMPYWCARDYEGQEYIEAEGWADGFLAGMALSPAAWKPLEETAQGKAWLHPIRMLGSMDLTPEEFKLVETPPQRHEFADQMSEAVLEMYVYWLPFRHANYEREVAKRLGPKVGRNDACPCGSGKKFKKCCGAAAVLH